jgi:nicotinamidase-related amidase
MPIDFDDLVHPAHTAVVTCEMQRGIIGDCASMQDLAREVAEIGMVERCVTLLRSARAAGIRVVHATIEFRADRAGTAINNPLMGAMTKNPAHILQGTAAAELLPELGPEPVDLTSVRTHGLSPFTGTDLDPLLRNLGATTIVPVGVSVNEALFGLCIEAANLGYRIALPTDAIAGYPRNYALDVIRHSLALMSNRTTVADIVAAWER